ncbi:MAG: prolyl oligopeptidase family serine peptidase [Acidobacteriota bacterium]
MTVKIPRPLLVSLVLAALCVAWSGPSAAAEWSLEDLVTAEAPRQVTLSADGSLAAWTVQGVVKAGGEEKTVSSLWMRRLDGAEGESLRLTRRHERISAVAFSPDARHLAFTTTREIPGEDNAGGPQLWLIPTGGGEAFAVTRFDRGVQGFAWIDAGNLLVARQESAGAREASMEDGKDTTVAVDDVRDAPPVRLFRVPVEGKAKRLTQGDDWIDQVAVSPDGRWAAITAQQSLSYVFDSRVPPQTFLVDLETGARTRILEGTNLLPQDLTWSPDSRHLYFVNDFTNHPLYRNATVSQVHRYDRSGGSVERVDFDWPRGYLRGLHVTDGGVVAVLMDGVYVRPARLGPDGARVDLEGEHARHILNLAVSRDGGRVLYASSTANRPPQIFAARLDGDRLVDPVQLSKLNPSWDDKPVGKTEVVRWTGALDEEVEGLLHYPLDWPADGAGPPAPLVLDIHGGPAGIDLDRWDSSPISPNILWRQRGAFVFQVNYHGSIGYGLEWVESIRERYYELEIPDIESGVDMLIERGLVDPERLASTGWSNGGILTAELITRTQRYKAAVVGAADVEWISDWANVDFGATFDNYYFGGPPWEKVDTYIEKSPFFRLTEVTTPTLVHTGTEDRAVPPHQSWSLFRVLQQLGNTDVRLLLYPGEPHGLRGIAHRRRKGTEDLEWLDRHLFGTFEAKEAAIAEGSPVEALLARAKAALDGARWGEVRGGTLVPELVEHGSDGLRVGRFEITRAQYAAFDPSYDVPAGTENHPATGMGFDKAKAYAAWLDAELGSPGVRLPSAEEAEALAGGGGNTLDHWAGYSPNPDDAAALLRAVGEAGASLLLPAGSLTATEGVFDLDGNAAEWAVGDDGAGVAAGPSAERSEDSAAESVPAAEYIGLRVVVGAAG